MAENDTIRLIEKYIDKAMESAHKGFRINAKRQAELWFCKCVKPHRKLRRR